MWLDQKAMGAITSSVYDQKTIEGGKASVYRRQSLDNDDTLRDGGGNGQNSVTNKHSY